ncbi:putative isomerase YbhE [Melanomma pulvis-pyrius CBS 109.77]|uniref:Putative isomerase YbhE n=1 Tax=Melanomma pulvis-pyrius CBS 109.77 TaxID=1314802 RepID=A0A6A6WWY2_9PLEO|nr:putative isomerase YbhE [Melanomma pulvis-pyrius CBS 109.77]
MAIANLLLATLAGSAAATKLYITSYAPPNATVGAVTTLELSPGLGQGALKSVAANNECGSAPTWLDDTLGNDVIFCVDEGFQTPNASINTLKINADGSLKSIAKVDTIQGPVSTQFFNKNKALALAHYGGSAISTFTVSGKGTFTPLQNFTFVAKGPRPEQEASHVHEAIIDPTGQYLLFPDLGADVVRVYCIDPATSLIAAHDSLQSKPGYGPRHAVFRKTGGKTYLYVIHELGNKIIAYKVEYLESGGLGFKEVQEIGLYGSQETPAGTKAAEISVSPDHRFIVASNRNATVFSVDNPDPKNSTKIPSDSLVTFAPKNDGTLEFVQLAPSGGSFPRHFKFNKDGSLIAVGNQNTFTVDVFTRNVKSGKLGARVASALIGAPVTNIVWDE